MKLTKNIIKILIMLSIFSFGSIVNISFAENLFNLGNPIFYKNIKEKNQIIDNVLLKKALSKEKKNLIYNIFKKFISKENKKNNYKTSGFISYGAINLSRSYKYYKKEKEIGYIYINYLSEINKFIINNKFKGLDEYINIEEFKKIIFDIINKKEKIKCDFSEFNLKINPILYYYNKRKDIILSRSQIKKAITCHITLFLNKYKKTYTLETYSANYRIYNINKAFDLLKGKIWRNGELINFGKLFLDADKQKNMYKIGYVLKKNEKTNKIEEVKEYGGGLCGATTLIYQGLLRVKGMDIIQRKPHSVWFRHLYGKNIGEDSTIYWGKYKNKNIIHSTLTIRNSTGNDIILFPYGVKNNGKFYTTLEIYSLGEINKENVKFLGIKEIKKNGKDKKKYYLAKTLRGKKTIISYYQKIK